MPSCLQPIQACATAPAPSPTFVAPARPPASLPAASGPRLQVGAWDVCDSDCRGETAYRPLLCVEAGLGVPTNLASCSYNLTNFQVSGAICE